MGRGQPVCIVIISSLPCKFRKSHTAACRHNAAKLARQRGHRTEPKTTPGAAVAGADGTPSKKRYQHRRKQFRELGPAPGPAEPQHMRPSPCDLSKKRLLWYWPCAAEVLPWALGREGELGTDFSHW